MAVPALKKTKLSDSTHVLVEHEENFLNANIPDTFVESLDRDRKGNGGERSTDSSSREGQKQLGSYIEGRQANSQGPTDFKSNMFTLQTEELLQKVRPPYETRLARLDEMLGKIKGIIENLPAQRPLLVVEAENELRRQHNIYIPYPEPPPKKDALYTFAFAKPTNINVVGSYARKTAIHVHDQLIADLAVTMPREIFQEKDYLNYRYFYKRAYYLAWIAAGIKKSEDTKFHLEYAHQNDNHLQPVIMITFNQNGGAFDLLHSMCQIRILLAIDEDVFPISKIVPENNCIRSRFDHAPSSGSPKTPTPFYNASLRSECCSLGYLKFLHNASSQSEGFNDACMLGSIWLRQRGFGAGLTRGGFGPFEWASTIALLMREGGSNGRPVLSKGCSSYQIFKATLLFLSVEDLVGKSTSISNENIEAPGHKGPILFDGGRGLNLLFKMTSWSYAMLRHEASETLKLLKYPYANQFRACFITKLDDPLLCVDRWARFPLCSDSTKPLTVDAYDDFTQRCLKAHQILRKGLDDRVFLVKIQSSPQSPWPVTSGRPQTSRNKNLLVGFLLNPEHMNRTVDRGPSAEDKEAASSFRRFWGEKAELRRFKDGSILESLVWSTSSCNSVLEQLLTHILRRHFGDAAANGLLMLGNTFDHMLPSEEVPDPLVLFQPIMTAYEVLEKEIRALEGMPLQIRQVSAADPQLRYASLEAPCLDSARSPMPAPANVYVQFEGSSRWPTDLAAVQRTKIAFLLKIGELLEGSVSTSDVSTRLGLENQTNDLLNIAFLDISYSSGAMFRLRIYHEREATVLERALASAFSGTDKEAIAYALSTIKRNYVQSPLHTQAVRLLCTRFPLLSPSLRLMKKWRDCHLLSHHFSDELIELLAIRSFIQPHPWSVPGSIIAGFLRTLAFISKWDWRSEPLIVDLRGEMKTDEYDAINVRFEAWRKIDPAMNRIAMFAASNINPEGISWTESGPSKVVAARLTSLARAACALVKEQGMDVQAATLFAPSSTDYDFVLHLNRSFVAENARRNVAQKSKFKNLNIQEQQDQTPLIFQPVYSFLEELRKLYGSNVIFFYNENGGSIIGGLWNPQTGPRSWKITVGYSTTPVKDAGGELQITLNKAGTLHEIARLGGDLISRIEQKQ